MPNILVYFIVPVFLTSVQAIHLTPNIDNNGVFEKSENTENKVAVETRIARRTPKKLPISLIFVVDVQQGSSERTERIRSEIVTLVNYFNKYDRELVKDYIFVQSELGVFRAPDYFANEGLFLDELRSFELYNNEGYCPTETLVGILDALELANPRSHIFIFTDGVENDYARAEYVMDLVKEKKTTVSFILTGICGQFERPDYDVFNMIVNSYRGKIHYYDPDVTFKIKQVLKDIEQKLNRQYAKLSNSSDTSQALEAPEAFNTSINFRPMTHNIEIDGNVYKIQISDPHNNLVDPIKTDLKDGQIFSVIQPALGTWNIKIGDDIYPVTVTEETSKIFTYGYSIDELNHMPDELLQSISDARYISPIKPSNDRNAIKPILLTSNQLDTTSQENDDGTGFINERWKLSAMIKVNNAKKNYPKTTKSTSRPNTKTTQRITRKPTSSPIKKKTQRPSEKSTPEPTIKTTSRPTTTLTPLSTSKPTPNPTTTSTLRSTPKSTPFSTTTSTIRSTAKTNPSTTEWPNPPIREILPQVFVDKTNISVDQGDPLVIDCLVKTSSNVSIAMMHDGKQLALWNINHTKTFKFEINSAQESDSGSYVCTIKHGYGWSESETVHVVVKEIELSDADVSILKQVEYVGEENQTKIEIPCLAQQKFKVDKRHVKWFFNGTEIYIDNKTYQVSGHFLIINNLSKIHRGLYKCEVKSLNHTAASDVHVIVHYPPKLSETTNEEYLVEYGGKVSLNCAADAFPMATTKWKKPFETEFTNFGESLTISSFKPSDAGVYICELDNGIKPNAQRVFNIKGQANKKPSILKPKISSVSITEGDDLILNCLCDMCEPISQMMWFQEDDQHNIFLNNKSEIMEVGDNEMNHYNYKLSLKNVSSTENGNHICNLSNEFGDDEVAINVNVKKKLDIDEIGRDDLKRRCILNKQAHVVQFDAKKSDMKISSNVYDCDTLDNENPDVSVVIIESNPNERVQTISIHSEESDSVSKCTLSELHPPDVTQILNPNTPKERTKKPLTASNDVFQCIFSPHDSSTFKQKPMLAIYVEPQISPSSDDAEIIQIHSHNDLEPVLKCSTASKATKWKDQPYDCESFNYLSSAKESFYILVNDPPRITTNFDDNLFLAEGLDKAIVCSAVGSSPIKVSWNDSGIIIPGNELRYSSELHHEKHFTETEFACIAENEFGSDYRTIKIKIIAKPEFTGNDNHNETKLLRLRGSETLTCPFEHFNHIEWFKHDEPISNTNAIELRNISVSEHEVNQRCRVGNEAGEDEYTFETVVFSPPFVTREGLNDTTSEVMEGDSFIAECEVDGVPYPEIEWIQYETVISADRTLFIDDINESYEGQFICKATNEFGSVSIVFNLNVLSLPKILRNTTFETKRVLIGSNVTLECPFENVDYFEWYKDGEPFSNETFDLTFQNVSAAYGGEFMCYVRNDALKDTPLNYTYEFIVYRPTFFENSTLNHTTIEAISENAFSVDCQVNGLPTPEIEWIHNGSVVSRNKTLQIDQVDVSHGGKYMCVAKNDYGMDNIEFNLDVLTKPKILDPYNSKKKLIKIGEDLALTCPFENFDNFTWLKNEQPFESQAINIDIFNISPAEEGQYECIVHNKAGINRYTYDVIVYAPPAIENTTLNGTKQTLISETKFLTDCQVSGYPAPEVSWTQNGTVISKSRTLIIDNVTKSNQGEYICTISNPYGNDSIKFDLNVLTQPKLRPGIDEFPKPKLIRFGEDITLELPFVNFDEFKWFKNGEPLGNQTQDIELKNISESSGGEYKCHVTNDGIEKEYTYKVIPFEPPTFEDTTLNHTTIKVKSGNRFSEDFQVNGFPNPEIEWIHNGTIISTNKALLIDSVNKTHEGTYIGTIKNKYGEESITFNVSVLTKPTKLFDGEENFEKKPIRTGTDLDLACPFENFDQIEWQKDGKPYGGKPTANIGIDNVSPNDTGRFTCIVKNEAGESNYTFDVVVHSPPILGNTSLNQTTVNVIAGHNFSTDFRVNGYPIPEIEWKHNDKVISTDPTWSFENINESQGGKYTFSAKNKHGAANIDFEINVLTKPKLKKGINGEPTTKEVRVGSHLILENPFENFDSSEWIKNDVIFGNQTLNLEFENITVENEGVYQIHAKNRAGDSDYEYKVIVYEPPTFGNSTLNQTTFEAISGTNFSTECLVNGYPLPKIEWKHNGTIISTNKSLVIVAVDESHDGQYVCTASNEYGTKSVEMHLNVLTKPKLLPGFDDKSNMKLLRLGQNETLKCPFENWDQYEWIRNDEHFKYQTFDVELTNINPEDEGIYKCRVKNGAGQEEYTYNITAFSPPIFEDTTQNHTTVTVISGDRYSIDCRVSGYPTPEIKWAHYGEIVSTNKTLFFDQVDKSRGGEYICTAENEHGRDNILINLDVLTKPSLLPGFNATSKIVALGSDLTLKCPFDGFDSIEWLKNDVPIDQTSRDIMFKNISFESEGKITCHVKNKAGENSYTHDVSVYSPPIFTNTAVNQTALKVNADTTFAIDCQVIGKPAPEVVWMHNGTVVSMNRKLLIDHVDESHEGEYECSAANEHGSGSIIFDLIVLTKPKLDKDKDPKKSLETKMIRLGSNVSLRCPFSDFTSLEWSKDEITINILNTSLELQTVAPIDEGLFTCHVSNEAGINEYSYRVIVFDPISFKNAHLNQTTMKAISEKNFSIDCQVAGYPKPDIEWSHDDKVISRKPELFIEYVDESYKGKYVCTARNKYNENSLVFNVTVLTKPELINGLSGYFTSKYVPIGGNVSFPCPFRNFEKHSWYQGMELLKNKSFDLTLQNVSIADEGKFTCQVENEGGKNEFTYEILVFAPPKFKNTSANQTFNVVLGKTFSTDCQVDAYPPPKFQWTRNGEILSNNENLLIQNVNISNQGQFVCTVENEHGVANMTYHLRVLTEPKPTSTSEYETLYSLLGSNLALECPFTNFDQIHWFKDTESFDKKIINLKLQNITSIDQAKYMCHVENEAGFGEHTFNVIVYSPPIFENTTINQTTIDVIAPNSFATACLVNGLPTPTIKWMHNGREISSDESLFMQDVTASDGGAYACVANNEHGTDKIQFKLNVLTAPMPEFDTDQHLEIFKNDPIKLNCTMEANPMPTYEWFKDGIKMLDQNASLIEIDQAGLADNGTYDCVATNSISSSKVQYEVNVKVGALIQSISKNATFEEGRPVTLSCDAIGNPLPVLAWVYDNINIVVSSSESKSATEIIESNLNMTNETSHVESDFPVKTISVKYPSPNTIEIDLKIEKCSAGLHNFKCFAFNDYNKDLRSTFVQSVLVPKFLSRENNSFKNIEGDSVSFDCDVIAYPMPEIVWLNNGNVFDFNQPNTEKYSLTNGSRTLHITNVTVDENGLYSCLAVNSVGKSEKQFVLEVLSPPKFMGNVNQGASNGSTPNETKLTAKKGGPMQIRCGATGKPEPEIYWTKKSFDSADQEDLKVISRGQTLEIDQIYENTIFQCHAQNPVSNITHDFSVDVVKAPEFSAESSNRTVVRYDINKGFELDCIVEGIPKPEIQWFKNGKQLSDPAFFSANKAYLKVKKATKDFMGNYTCLAENDAGQIKRTFKVIHKPYWSPWSKWGECSVTCGKGAYKRHRTCLRADEEGNCRGLNVQSRVCELPPCVGVWSEWSDWSGCSKSCGSGQMYKHRSCLYGECLGTNIEIVKCFRTSCDDQGGTEPPTQELNKNKSRKKEKRSIIRHLATKFG